MLLIPAEMQPLVALLALGLLFVAFLTERYPPDVTAAGAAALFVILGLTPPDRVLEVFSNPAPITIAAMFVISGALVRTGLLDALAALVTARAEKRPALAVVVFLGATLLASGIVNNTPVVLILIPVMIQLARSLGIAETRLLIPLSYAAILGGTLTLIGSSTNILVAGVASQSGLEPFGIFEIAGVGLMVALAGGAGLALLGPWLLPDRRTRGEAGGGETVFLTEIRLAEGFADLGRALSEVADLNRPGVRITARREGKTLRRSGLEDHELAAGDVFVAQASTSEILTLRGLPGLTVGLPRGSGARTREEDLVVAEAMVTPTHGSPRDTVSQLSVGYRYGLRVLGAHRQGHVVGPDLGSARLRPADKLLLEGTAEGFDRLAQGHELVSVARPSGRAYRRRRAPLALSALLLVVGLAAFDLAPIALLALGAVAAILLMRCIDNDEAWGSVDASILVLIFAMLIVGVGLEETGTVALIVDVLAPWLEGLPPIALLAALYALTSLLTETVTNNAVAVVVTPIAVALGEATGVDPRPLVVAVMMGASASFATPVGYQTNTLVYGAGEYRFADFLRIGVPMNLVAGVAAVLAIPLFFPLVPG